MSPIEQQCSAGVIILPTGPLAVPDDQRISTPRIGGFGQLARRREGQLARATLPDREQRRDLAPGISTRLSPGHIG
eukprot:8138110-Pyramimonas_sp.AAC.1